jgi:hypothetical protein
MPATDGTITFNATEVYNKLTLMTGACRGMITELQQAQQWPIANRLEQLVAQYGIETGAVPPTGLGRTVTGGRPIGQVTNSGRFGTTATAPKKKKVH